MTNYEANFSLNRNKLQADLVINATVHDKYFAFTQAVSSNVWVINHNLNKKPSVTVVDSADSVVTPDEIKYDDLNTCTIYFLAEFSGKAYLN